MINWTYKSEDFKLNENMNDLIPEGDHRVVVSRVMVKTYNSGNDGFEIMLDVSGHNGKLWHRIIMDPTNPEKTNHHLGKFFESFGITNYDLNCYKDWVGKDGAVRVKHDSYNGSMSSKVLFCITRAYQAKLPKWREPMATRTEVAPTNNRTFNRTPALPNEHVNATPPYRQMKFEGFSF
jgi:hypothetical protein